MLLFSGGCLFALWHKSQHQAEITKAKSVAKPSKVRNQRTQNPERLTPADLLIGLQSLAVGDLKWGVCCYLQQAIRRPKSGWLVYEPEWDCQLEPLTDLAN